MLHREVLMGMIGGIRLVGAPTVGPDFCRVQDLLAGAQDDTDRLIFED